MSYVENNSQEISRSLTLFQRDVVCFLLVNGRYALCQRVLDDLVVLRIEDHPMKDFRLSNLRRDPARGDIIIEDLLPVVDTIWMHIHV